MDDAEKKLNLKQGMKKYTATEVASRMSYWMKKTPKELDEAASDEALSILDQITIQALMRDFKYGALKNTDLMLSRIIGTPVNQTILSQKVEMNQPVRIDLIGVEVGDEDSLKALEDLRGSEDTPLDVAQEAAQYGEGTDGD